MKKLPVFRAIGEVFSGVTRHYFRLLWLALTPLTLMFASAIVLGVLIASEDLLFPGLDTGIESPGDREPDWTWPTIVVAIFTVLVILYAYGAMVARWHRFVLLGEVRVRRNAFFGRINLRYMITTLKIMLVLLFVALPLSFFGTRLSDTVSRFVVMALAPLLERTGELAPGIVAGIVKFIVFVLPLTLVIARIVLALPDAAVGRKGSIEAIFETTRGNTLRLAALLLVTGLVVQVIDTAAVNVAEAAEAWGGPDNPWFALLWLAIYVPLSFFGIMLYFTSLSVAYREIVGLPGGHEGEATVAEPTPGL